MLLSSLFSIHPILEAGKKFDPRCDMLQSGIMDGYLTTKARAHARSMAARRHQDHNGWERRYVNIHDEFRRASKDLARVSEICAESWPGDDAKTAAAGCWKDWKTSPGHWQTAAGRPTRFGVAMARGKNGVYYICIIAVWERP
jgi:uncharacterized protein YkwD